jgi:hypothetical protein
MNAFKEKRASFLDFINFYKIEVLAAGFIGVLMFSVDFHLIWNILQC